jgi:hypothetical protein
MHEQSISVTLQSRGIPLCLTSHAQQRRVLGLLMLVAIGLDFRHACWLPPHRIKVVRSSKVTALALGLFVAVSKRASAAPCRLLAQVALRSLSTLP